MFLFSCKAETGAYTRHAGHHSSLLSMRPMTNIVSTSCLNIQETRCISKNFLCSLHVFTYLYVHVHTHKHIKVYLSNKESIANISLSIVFGLPLISLLVSMIDSKSTSIQSILSSQSQSMIYKV